MFLESIHLQGFLSFPPDAPPIPLKALNVLIGPNGSGKSNLIEAISLLKALPNDVGATLRLGETFGNLIWKGGDGRNVAKISIITHDENPNFKTVYGIEFSTFISDFRVISEYLYKRAKNNDDLVFYENTRFNKKIRIGRSPFEMERTPFGFLYPSDLVEMGMNDFSENKSILSQKRDYYVYNELTSISFYFDHCKILTDWSFGGGSVARQAQNASGIYFALVNGGGNLSLYLNEIYFKNHEKINNALSRFLPRFESIKTRVSNGVVQVYFLEKGISEPIPISRLSDGTLRFLAIISLLCDANPLGILCIEEPELGLHPDAAALLAELLVEASQRMQIIVTTHSEAFLSALTRHDVNVLVTENFGEGTEVTQVDQEELSSWLDKYTLGDLWRIGKIGGNP